MGSIETASSPYAVLAADLNQRPRPLLDMDFHGQRRRTRRSGIDGQERRRRVKPTEDDSNNGACLSNALTDPPGYPRSPWFVGGALQSALPGNLQP